MGEIAAIAVPEWSVHPSFSSDGLRKSFDATGLVVGHIECAETTKEGLRIRAGGRS
jgi:hypothetical protein